MAGQFIAFNNNLPDMRLGLFSLMHYADVADWLTPSSVAMLCCVVLLQAGQFIGARADFMPDQICRKLCLLQDQVPPMSPARAKQVGAVVRSGCIMQRRPSGWL